MILPKLGLTMEEGRIVAWHKREGERVSAGEVLFEVETDKATMEVETPAAGIVRRILVPADESAPIASVIAIIADSADEALPSLDAPVAVAAEPAPSGEVAPTRTIAPPSQDGERLKVSPAARKRASELGVDLARVAATGPGGRISLEDVEAAAAAAAAGRVRRQPLSRMRRAVAEAMSRSNRDAPQFSISRDVDMGAADERRRAAGVSYTDVIVGACAAALRAHPRLRARFDADAIAVSDGVHVGIAVALEDGLIVPVIRDADRKDLATLRRAREVLEAAARSGKLPADAIGDAVLTVSNLGTFGVDRFTAIVNPPEAGILAVGRVSDRVVARDGAPAVRPIVTLTLSVDHRVADGADAARFLADVVKHLEGSD